MVNDGWNDKSYDFGDDAELNARLSALINEFCHVFRAHPDGKWKTVYKPKYAELMAAEIQARPSLIRKLKALKDPVVSNVTYGAIELAQKAGQSADAHNKPVHPSADAPAD